MSNPLRDQVRWVLRTLVEPPFLRLYLEDERVTFRAFEDAFFALCADGERPERERRAAWKRIVGWVGSSLSQEPERWFCEILRGIRCLFKDEKSEHLAELGQFWALGELFNTDSQDEPDPFPEGAPKYHEIHCHLRSGVPFLAMWRGYVESDRKRAALRTHPFECKSGRWKKTWAELTRDAATSRKALSRVPYLEAIQDETEYLQMLTQYLFSSPDPALFKAAVRYLATCAGLSAVLTYQRGEPGLSPFDKAYERYSKAQKLRAGPHRQNTRALVAAALRRFEEDGAAAVELRPTLDRRPRDIQDKLMDVVDGYLDYLAGATDEQGATKQGRSPVLMGLVTSLVKTEGTKGREPSDPAFWEAQEEIWVHQIKSLLTILNNNAALRYFVVGVDAAGRERGCPLRALKRAFAEVRRYNVGRAAARPGRSMGLGHLQELLAGSGSTSDRVERARARLLQRPILSLRLGITVHAGEDFEDPMTGLRNIWEAAVDLDLDEGERIGHALAAGLNQETVQKFFERRAQDPHRGVEKRDDQTFLLSKPRGAHMLDLAWIGRAGERSDRALAALMMGDVATRAYGAPMGAERLVRELSRHGALARAALPGVRYVDPGEVAVHDREVVHIDERWCALTERMRLCVVRELARRHIVVESCPTSNLVVPNLDGEPPLLAFLEMKEKGPSVDVALATDNPGLLGCYPRFEMQRIKPERRNDLLGAAARASFVRHL